jgi:hypothetical protein
VVHGGELTRFGLLVEEMDVGRSTPVVCSPTNLFLSALLALVVVEATSCSLDRRLVEGCRTLEDALVRSGR